MQSIDENTFSNTLSKSNKTVVVIFGASWCAPCKQLMSMFNKIEKDFNDKIEFCKIDIDDSPTITSMYNIKSVPTILMFKNNNLICQRTGTFSATMALQSFVQENTV